MAGGRQVKCRRCGHGFSVTAAAEPGAAPAKAKPVPTEFHHATTQVTKVEAPAKKPAPAAQDLTAMLESLGGKAAAPAPAPKFAGDPTATTIDKVPAFVPAPTAPPSSASLPLIEAWAPARGTLPPFPREALQAYGVAFWRWLRGKPWGLQLALWGLPLFVMVAGVALVVWSATGVDTQVGYLDERLALHAGPGDESIYPKVAQLERGDEVLVFAGGDVGDYVMVRDVMGRAGFLPRAFVSPHRPASMPALPFAGCRQAPIERDPDRCRARAEAQLKSCRGICAADDNETACLEHCQRQFATCLRGCAGEATPPGPALRLEEPPPPAKDASAGDDAKKKRPAKKVTKKKKR